MRLAWYKNDEIEGMLRGGGCILRPLVAVDKLRELFWMEEVASIDLLRLWQECRVVRYLRLPLQLHDIFQLSDKL